LPLPSLLFEQDFAQFEEALQDGSWEVDGDNLNLYLCEEGDGKLGGAVLVTEGNCDSDAELVRCLDCSGSQGGEGPRVTRVTTQLLCEELDEGSGGAFTAALAYGEDLVEAMLLALTLRRARPDADEEDTGGKPIALFANGTSVVEDIGPLPRRVELEAVLHWDEDPRRTVVQYRILPAPGAEGAGAVGAECLTGEATVGFYTTSAKFEGAKAFCLRATGTTRIQFLHASCACA